MPKLHIDQHGPHRAAVDVAIETYCEPAFDVAVARGESSTSFTEPTVVVSRSEAIFFGTR